MQFPSNGRLDSNQVAIVIGEQLLAREEDSSVAARIRPRFAPSTSRVSDDPGDHAAPALLLSRVAPTTCRPASPKGSRALAGIGCHYMAQWMDRETATYTQMGAEGASWIGQAPFSTRKHVFQNIGDGTYFHSGLVTDPCRGRGGDRHHIQDSLSTMLSP